MRMGFYCPRCEIFRYLKEDTKERLDRTYIVGFSIKHSVCGMIWDHAVSYVSDHWEDGAFDGI